MIRLTTNPFQLDPDCSQVSCHFDVALYQEETAPLLQLSLPHNLHSAVPKRKAEFIAGRYCARQALENLHADPTTVDIGENRSPVWPPGFVGSITHTHGYASAIVANHVNIRSVGLDSEQWILEKTAGNVAKQILTDAEIFTDYQDLFESQRHFLTMVFSAKESIFKCLYPMVKQFFGFHAAVITPLPFDSEQNTGRFEFELLQDLNAEFAQGYRGCGQYSMADDLVHTSILLKTNL